MLQQWLSAYRVEALYERGHSIADLERFLRREGRDVGTRFIYITCHGEDLRGCGTAKLLLTFEKVDLVKDCKIFEGLDGKVLIFSCYEVGNDQPLVAAYMQQFRDLPPQELGVQVCSPDGQSGILSILAVEIRGGKGQVKRTIIPLAVDEQGRRLLVWERQPEKHFRAQPVSGNSLSAEAKLALLRTRSWSRCFSARLHTVVWPWIAEDSRLHSSTGWKRRRDRYGSSI